MTSRLLEFDDEVRWILGQPIFKHMRIVHIHRQAGIEISSRMEDEQAHVLFWMLDLYQKHGADWRAAAEAELTEQVASISKSAT